MDIGWWSWVCLDGELSYNAKRRWCTSNGLSQRNVRVGWPEQGLIFMKNNSWFWVLLAMNAIHQASWYAPHELYNMCTYNSACIKKNLQDFGETNLYSIRACLYWCQPMTNLMDSCTLQDNCECHHCSWSEKVWTSLSFNSRWCCCKPFPACHSITQANISLVLAWIPQQELW